MSDANRTPTGQLEYHDAISALWARLPNGGVRPVARIHDADSIAEMTGCPQNGTPEFEAESHDWGQFIVHACNAHYDLISAAESARAFLRAVSDKLSAGPVGGVILANVVEKLDAAVAKAGGDVIPFGGG